MQFWVNTVSLAKDYMAQVHECLVILAHLVTYEEEGIRLGTKDKSSGPQSQTC